MANVFITGATGFIGGSVLRELLDSGDHVRALVRPGSELNLSDDCRGAENLEVVEGDLLNSSRFQEKLEGCEILYHIAGRYSLWNPDPSEIYEVNVEGTRRLLDAALESQVRRVVHTTTVGTLRVTPDLSSTSEADLVDLTDLRGHYKRSKWQSEHLTLSYQERGLEVVVVQPSVPIGERDIKPTPTGEMILEFLKGRVPAYTDTGLNLVPVEDCARGHLLAAQRGRSGERYILGGENIELKALYQILSELTGISPPRWRMPCWLLAPIAEVEGAWARRRGSIPRVPWEAIEMAKYKMFFSSEKAKKELGYTWGDIRTALIRSVLWFYKNGYAKPLDEGKIDYLSSLIQPSDLYCDASS